jgi:uncharacterized protein (DUF983 family)
MVQYKIIDSEIALHELKVDKKMGLLEKISQGKCPNCGKEKVFSSNGNVFLFKAPQMKEKCSECNKKFEKEPGYFVGAMYFSYALCVIEMALIFVLYNLTNLPLEYLAYAVIFPVVMFWPFNFRMSRIIWMNVI